jgi:hypothetical protein
MIDGLETKCGDTIPVHPEFLFGAKLIGCIRSFVVRGLFRFRGRALNDEVVVDAEDPRS